MNTDEALIWFTTMDPAEAPPAIIAKLLPHMPALVKFAESVKERANELARADALPGYGKGTGRAKPMAWVEGADLPAFLFESKPVSPAAAIKAKLVSEETITKHKWAERGESDVVAVKLEEATPAAAPKDMQYKKTPVPYSQIVPDDEAPFL